MAEKEPKPSRRLTMHAVDSDDFIRFLSAKAGDTDPCWVCKADDWMIMCPDEGPTFRFGIPVRNAEKVFYASIFMYYCINCGFIRQHSSKVVKDWVQQNQLELDLDDQSTAEREDEEDV